MKLKLEKYQVDYICKAIAIAKKDVFLHRRDRFHLDELLSRITEQMSAKGLSVPDNANRASGDKPSDKTPNNSSRPHCVLVVSRDPHQTQISEQEILNLLKRFSENS